MQPLGLRTPRRANCPAVKRKPGSRLVRRVNRLGVSVCTSSRRWRVNFSSLAVILRSLRASSGPLHAAPAWVLDTPLRSRQTPPVLMPILDTPYASLDLIRQPEQPNDPLQAFDAADEYLLAQLHEQGLPAATRVLILNDSFGALACSLAAHVAVTSSGDSHLGHLALQKNLARNELPAERVRFVPASEVAQGPFDRVLIRVPKTLALLEEQLIRLHGQLAPSSEAHTSELQYL